jgi:hypothetical protein
MNARGLDVELILVVGGSQVECFFKQAVRMFDKTAWWTREEI